MNDAYRPQARVIAPGVDYTDPLAQDYRLYVFRKFPDNTTQVLYTNGPTNVTLEEGDEYPSPSMTIPPEFVIPLYEALGEALGKTGPTDTTVLREWLDAERRRVDDFLRWEYDPKADMEDADGL